MHNLGDEFILDIHRIPWLIWIQLLILFLLILLLSYLGLDFTPAVSSPPSNISSAVVRHQERGSQETQMERAGGSEGNAENDGSSAKDLRRLFHPCFYLDLAKKAFLQCLGLGSTPLNPRERGNGE